MNLMQLNYDTNLNMSPMFFLPLTHQCCNHDERQYWDRSTSGDQPVLKTIWVPGAIAMQENQHKNCLLDQLLLHGLIF